jgi:hypothetical protein
MSDENNIATGGQGAQAEAPEEFPIGARKPFAEAVQCIENLYQELRRDLVNGSARIELRRAELEDLRRAWLSCRAARTIITRLRVREHTLAEVLRTVDQTIDFSELPAMEAEIKAALAEAL